MSSIYFNELSLMIEASIKASKEIMRIYNKGFQINIKSDNSFVTDADFASNRILRESLQNAFPEIGWLSEEDADNMERLDKKAIFIVDPLDGTADFVKKDGEFGINVALVVDRHPVAAVVAVPAKEMYAYAIKGYGSYYVDFQGRGNKLHVSDRTKDLIVLGSNSFPLPEEDAVIERHKDIIAEYRHLGASTKAISLASGEADASVRYTKNTKEWDVCAPELIVTEAGGIFTDSKLVPFTYNREDVYNHDGYSMFNRTENTILLK